jgi:transcriptional regulator with XRE-family HTH domain
MARTKTALQKVREAMGFTSRRVAEVIGIDISGFHRIEIGENTPTRDTARRLWKFYREAVPLGVIYDPRHKESQAWASFELYNTEIATTAAKLLRDYPELGDRIKRVDGGRRRRAR